MNFNLDLDGRRALVTGGTKGVGAAIVQTLHHAGVRMVTTARHQPQRPTPGGHYIAGDVATAKGCAMVAEEALRYLGGIDILVNVVGGSSAPGGGFSKINDDIWQSEIDLT